MFRHTLTIRSSLVHQRYLSRPKQQNVSVALRYNTQGPNLLELVKQLRKQTNAGISDCKDALQASDLDIEKAKEFLIEKAKKTAAKKSSRMAYEGGVLCAVKDNVGVMMEVNSETDFAARDKNFLSTLQGVASSIHQNYKSLDPTHDAEKIKQLPHNAVVSGLQVNNVSQAIEQLSFLFKENVRFRRYTVCPTPEKKQENSFVQTYVHNTITPPEPGTFGKMGKIGVLLHLSTSQKLEGEKLSKLSEFSFQLCVHIAASKTKFLSEIPADYKPDELTKDEFEEGYTPVLLEQDFLFDTSSKVKKVLKSKEKELGTTVKIEEFTRWELSEGIVRTEVNIANEVQKLLNNDKSH